MGFEPTVRITAQDALAVKQRKPHRDALLWRFELTQNLAEDGTPVKVLAFPGEVDAWPASLLLRDIPAGSHRVTCKVFDKAGDMIGVYPEPEGKKLPVVHGPKKAWTLHLYYLGDKADKVHSAKGWRRASLPF